MGIRNKVFGVIAAAAMTLSMFAGAAAQPAQMQANPNPDGVCTVSAGPTTVDFGTYEWNGTNFVRVTPQPKLAFTISQTLAPSSTPPGCNVKVTISDLTNVTHVNPAYVVSQASLSLQGGTGLGAATGTIWMYGNGTSNLGPQVVTGGDGNYEFNLGISHATSPEPNNRIKAVGTYEGTAIITVSPNVAP